MPGRQSDVVIVGVHTRPKAREVSEARERLWKRWIEPVERRSMRFPSPTRVLIAARQTADSPQLVEAVARRASEGPSTFTLLVPAVAHGLHRVVDPEDHGHAEAEARLAVALPLLSDAARAPIAGMVGSHEPFAAVQDALNLVGFDEVIISMPPVRMSRWLHLDLPRKVRALGVPVTEVISADRRIGDIPPSQLISVHSQGIRVG